MTEHPTKHTHNTRGALKALRDPALWKLFWHTTMHKKVDITFSQHVGFTLRCTCGKSWPTNQTVPTPSTLVQMIAEGRL